MKSLLARASLAVIGATLATACAQTGTAIAPEARAQQQCGYFAREEGLRLLQVTGVEADGNSYRVKMRLEDGLNRKLDATCIYAANGNRAWAQALPSYVRI